MDHTHQTYTTGSVTSKDGTIIGYRQLGSGPGIILVHGAVSSSQLFMKLGLPCPTRSPSTFQTGGAGV